MSIYPAVTLVDPIAHGHASTLLGRTQLDAPLGSAPLPSTFFPATRAPLLRDGGRVAAGRAVAPRWPCGPQPRGPQRPANHDVLVTPPLGRRRSQAATTRLPWGAGRHEEGGVWRRSSYGALVRTRIGELSSCTCVSRHGARPLLSACKRRGRHMSAVGLVGSLFTRTSREPWRAWWRRRPPD